MPDQSAATWRCDIGLQLSEWRGCHGFWGGMIRWQTGLGGKQRMAAIEKALHDFRFAGLAPEFVSYVLSRSFANINFDQLR